MRRSIIRELNFNSQYTCLHFAVVHIIKAVAVTCAIRSSTNATIRIKAKFFLYLFPLYWLWRRSSIFS